MWARRGVRAPGVRRAKRHFAVNDTRWCALAILLALGLSSCAFLLPLSWLHYLGLANLLLLIQGRYLGGRLRGLLVIFTSQLAITSLLYLLLHGLERLPEGIIAVCRILMAMIPGWWLSVACSPQRIGEVLSFCLPHKWAFVLAACFGILPYLGQETREIYQMQVMRGANIRLKSLWRPKHWRELIYCVLYPLLIQLLKLSKQMATAARLRQFGRHPKPTHWPY
ncbi:energy-coupling factor transporter transmembrane component T [Shewanella sp. Isolate8]|uniref:energy-coupling factor transporter transmembrane component T n=1 Tax=Shewanella sp. Isolate8 TaxID=2908529 RepID=UPI001EFD8301|nr:energy-coupling factor transporter transmembrane protein EcfT [Shewanella sp. Isolate8]